MSMLDNFVDAVEDRLGVVSLWESFRDQSVHGGVRLRHVFPAVIAYLFVQQAVLGIALATYFSPSSTDAWASTAYIQDQVVMGWFVRGLHYHGTSVLIVVIGLWLGQMVLHRAYKAPREVTWWAGLGLLGLGLALGLTGNPLPWDQAGYWGIQVELAIAEQTPGGSIIRTMIQGGSDAGNLTILRLYALHVLVLPGAFLGLLWLIHRQRDQHGAPAPDGMSDAEAHRTTQNYFPSQAFLDVLAMAAVGGIVVAMTVTSHGAELLGPADPTQNFQARPEWYFLFLYKLRTFFEGPLEPIATMLIPGAAATFLFAAPFIDRVGGKVGRIAVMAGMGLLMTGTVGLTAYGIQSDKADEEYQKALAASEASAEEARAYAKIGVVPLGGPAVFYNDPEYQTKLLYKEHCQGCHALGGVGGDEGPSLEDYSSRAWLAGLIRDPNTAQFFGNTKMKDEMDPYAADDLPQEQLDAVVEYLVELQADPAMPADATLAKKGAALWEDELDCSGCHEVEQGEEGAAPNLFQHGSQAWVERVIRDDSAADLFGDYASMPKFKDKLSDDEIAALAAFVVKQRASDEEAPAEAAE
ncbi:MAG: cytochrome b N-terminal domain-containing protein [Myxococcota bacterium]